MSEIFHKRVNETLEKLKDEGLFKTERLIQSAQSTRVKVSDNGVSRQAINLCANNYLGLADSPELVKAASEAMSDYGFGAASVRFICGTFDLHRELETKIAQFFKYEDAITFAACFDANGGVFEPLLGPNDAIVSDSLNHASIIDGVRLCKAKRYRFSNNNMDELEAKLIQAKDDGAETILIVTDGVFSMDGIIADLKGITDLATKYDALVMVDDCHASGFLGVNGRGTAEYCGVEGRIDILTSTLGKALGGGMGGFICAKQNIIDLLRQKARPYLFSNALTPALVGASIKAFDLVENGKDLRATLHRNAEYFRREMTRLGFSLPPGQHPIIPIMLGDAKVAQSMAARLFEEGIFVTGFYFPVVPRGQARIRTQMSAAHSRADIDMAITAFEKVGLELGVITKGVSS